MVAWVLSMAQELLHVTGVVRERRGGREAGRREGRKENERTKPQQRENTCTIFSGQKMGE